METTKKTPEKSITITDGGQDYNVTIVKNKQITIDCFYKNHINPKQTSVTLKMGDQAEYDSYNLSYLGIIIGITEKTVTFEVGTPNQPETKRLKMKNFCWRNWDFNLEKTLKSNLETSFCI